MEVVSTNLNVEALRLFGSYARGEETDKSDYDILVVLKKSQLINRTIEEDIKKLFEREISISWYSKNRLEMMFKMGHLFAWHIFLESKLLSINNDFISKLGAPKQYSYSKVDVMSLLDILEPIGKAANDNPRNVVYEAGLTYVCARNIAICSLPNLKGEFSFSVRAPFELGLDLSENDFETLIDCRYASTRGAIPPNINIEWFLDTHKKILTWGITLLKMIK